MVNHLVLWPPSRAAGFLAYPYQSPAFTNLKERIPVSVDHRPAWYRLLEVCAAAGSLTFFLPLMIFVALLIKMDSPGPVLFRQPRLARGGRTFTFVKFRTMAIDANARFPKLAPNALRNEDTVTLRLQMEDDPRVTNIGRWLRRTSIDEIPNFIHVLTGDMALVGPRPEMPEILPHYSDEQLAKFSVLPGITGYAQIYGRGDLTFLETVEQDLRYLRERSVKADIRVVLMTLRGVLTRRGAW